MTGGYEVSSVYSLYNRKNYEGEEISPEQAKAIIKNADLHTGPFGGMGARVDRVIYEDVSNEEVGDEGIVVRAIRYKGRWLEIPAHQNPYIESELNRNSWEVFEINWNNTKSFGDHYEVGQLKDGRWFWTWNMGAACDTEELLAMGNESGEDGAEIFDTLEDVVAAIEAGDMHDLASQVKEQFSMD